MSNIRQFLDLSTAHLTPETRERLDSITPSAWPVAGGAMPHGYFIYVHDENVDDSIPDDLWRCMEYAQANGAVYMLFDADAEIDPTLPLYDDDL